MNEFRSTSQQNKFLVVENYKSYSHTFIRNDRQRQGIDSRCVIDISDYSLRKRVLLRGLSASFVLFSKLAVFDPITAISLCASKANRKSFIHALYIAAMLKLSKIPGLNDWSKVTLRCHFLGKASLVGYIFKRLYGSKLVIICHGSDLYASGRGINIILKYADIVECVTIFGKGFVYGRIGDAAIGKVKVVRNAISGDLNVDPTLKASGVSCWDGSVLRAILVGRMVPQKNIAFALDVVKQLRTAFQKDVKLFIIGDGPLMPELVALVHNLCINDDVIFCGAQGHDTVLQQMMMSDFLIMPCLEKNLYESDGLPVVIQEALRLGVPVFCSQAFGVFEFIINGFNGWAFEIDSKPEDWADVIVGKLGGMDRKLIQNLSRYQF